MERSEREQFLAALGERFDPVDEAMDDGWWAIAARGR
jgi:hypothetical protein